MRNRTHSIFRQAVNLLGISLFLLAVSEPLAATAQETLSFDRNLKEGTIRQASGDSEGAMKSFAMAARTDSEGVDFRILLERLLDPMAEHPLDPNGHLAMGLIYRMCLLPAGLKNDWSLRKHFYEHAREAEAELKTYIWLSPNHQSADGEFLLHDVEERRKTDADCNRKEANRKNYWERLLHSRWLFPALGNKQVLLLSRIRITSTDDNELLAELTVPSGNSAYDASVMAACVDTLREFRMLKWTPKEFTFFFEYGTCDVIDASIDRQFTMNDLARKEPAIVRTELQKALCDEADTFLKARINPQDLHEYCLHEPYELWEAKDFLSHNTGNPALSESMEETWQRRSVVAGNWSESRELPPVEWFASVKADKILTYHIWMRHFKHDWNISIDPTEKWIGSADFFLTRLMRHNLFLPLFASHLAHQFDRKGNEWEPRRPDQAPWSEKVERDSSNKAVAYSCGLSNGRRVRASLDDKSNITSVSVDGAPDAVWNKAVVGVRMYDENDETTKILRSYSW